MNANMLIDAVGMIDYHLIEAYVEMDQMLMSRVRAKNKRRLSVLLAAAISVSLIFTLMLTSVPVIYITNADSINKAIGQTVDDVIFPMDDPEYDPAHKQFLQLNWQEWGITESMFETLGAGSEDSKIEQMQSSQSGLVGELWQSLGDLLARMFEYYQKYSEKYGGSVTNGVVFDIEPNGEFCKIIGVKSYHAKRINVPSKIGNYTVQSIGENAFAGLEFIEINLPDTIDTVENHAFSGCASLTAVEMPGVTEIGEHAFEDCANLATVTMPLASRVGAFAFANCQSLSSIDISGTHRIGERAFSGCSDLSQITASSKLGTIGDYAFENCTSLHAISLEKNVQSLGIGCFAGCSSLRNVNFYCSNAIPDYFFDGCTSLQMITFYYGCEEIGAYALRNCRSFIGIAGVWSVRKIGEGAFEGCGMRDLNLYRYESDTIYENTAVNCQKLRSVTIPNNVKKICSNAFVNCPLLEQITYQGTKAQFSRVDVEANAIPDGVKIRCDDGYYIP